MIDKSLSLCEMPEVILSDTLSRKSSQEVTSAGSTNSRVESWRSGAHALSAAPPRRTVHAVFPHTTLQSSSSSGIPLAWLSGIAPTEYPGTCGVDSVAAISFPSLLQKHDEGIAPSRSQGYVVLEIQTVYYEQLRLPCRPGETSFPLYSPVAVLHSIDKGLPRSLSYDFPCVPPLLPQESIYRLW
jgi:hypothetical protein